jgi:hypothetical protein
MSLHNNVSLILMTMIKSSKTLTVMLITYFFPKKGAKVNLKRANIIFGMVITAGLVIFNFSVKKKLLTKSKENDIWRRIGLNRHNLLFHRSYLRFLGLKAPSFPQGGPQADLLPSHALQLHLDFLARLEHQ